MNPVTPDEAKNLALKTKNSTKNKTKTKTVICPPTPFIPLITPKRKSKNLFFGAQDAFFKSRGSHTGEVSPEMLKSLGCEYVILGHSERRARGETNDIVAKKVELAIRSGLKVILCVGESRRDKEGKYLDFLRTQVKESLVLLKKSYFKEVLIAYEPIWAIGSDAKGADTPDNFFENSLFVRKVFASVAGNETALKLPILYGGSANTDNAEGFMKDGRADGLLIGRASLAPDQIKEIISIADKVGNLKSKYPRPKKIK